jgi:hypothetical protein
LTRLSIPQRVMEFFQMVANSARNKILAPLARKQAN